MRGFSETTCGATYRTVHSKFQAHIVNHVPYLISILSWYRCWILHLRCLRRLRLIRLQASLQPLSVNRLCPLGRVPVQRVMVEAK